MNGPDARVRTIGQLGHRVLDRRKMDVRVGGLDQGVVQDEVLVDVRGAKRFCGDVTEHRANGHDTGPNSRIAPAAESASATLPKGIPRTSPPRAAASAATVPAACPIAMHWAMDRIDAWASCSAEKQRPAISVFVESRATNVDSGMPTASPSLAAPT